jgi:hypothetical protein
MADQHEMLLATRTYGVLMGRVEAGCLDLSGSSQHSERWTEAGDKRSRRGQRSFGRLIPKVLVDDDPATVCRRARCAGAGGRTAGLIALSTDSGGTGLNHFRDGLFLLAGMHQPIPPDRTCVTPIPGRRVAFRTTST